MKSAERESYQGARRMDGGGGFGGHSGQGGDEPHTAADRVNAKPLPLTDLEQCLGHSPNKIIYNLLYEVRKRIHVEMEKGGKMQVLTRKVAILVGNIFRYVMFLNFSHYKLGIFRYK